MSERQEAYAAQQTEDLYCIEAMLEGGTVDTFFTFADDIASAIAKVRQAGFEYILSAQIAAFSQNVIR